MWIQTYVLMVVQQALYPVSHPCASLFLAFDEEASHLSGAGLVKTEGLAPLLMAFLNSHGVSWLEQGNPTMGPVPPPYTSQVLSTLCIACSACPGSTWGSSSLSPPSPKKPHCPPTSSLKSCIYLNVISPRCELEQIWSSCFVSKCPLGTPLSRHFAEYNDDILTSINVHVVIFLYLLLPQEA